MAEVFFQKVCNIMELLDSPVRHNATKVCNLLLGIFVATAAGMFFTSVISSGVSLFEEYVRLVKEYSLKGATIEKLRKHCLDERMNNCDIVFNHDTSSNPYLLALRMVLANSYYCGNQSCLSLVVDMWNSISVVNFLVAAGVIFFGYVMYHFVRSMAIGNGVLPQHRQIKYHEE